MVFMQKLEEPTINQEEASSAGEDPEWGVSTCRPGRAIPHVLGHGIAVGLLRAGSLCRNCIAGLTEKGDSHAAHQSISLSFLFLLSQVWCIKPRKAFECVVKAVWCNPMKITDFWSCFCVKSFLPSKTCLQLAVFMLCVVVLWVEKPYLSENFQYNWY